MGRYSEAVEGDVKRRLSPPYRQCVAQFTQELGIYQLS